MPNVRLTALALVASLACAGCATTGADRSAPSMAASGAEASDFLRDGHDRAPLLADSRPAHHPQRIRDHSKPASPLKR